MGNNLFGVAVLYLFAISSSAQVSTGGKDIAVDPQGQVAVIAGAEDIIRSTDGGLTWSPTPAPYPHPMRVLVHRGRPQTLIVAKHGEIAYSTTAGTEPWSVALQESSLVPVRMLQSLISPDVILLSSLPAHDTSPLWLSDNSGQTWNRDTGFTSGRLLHDMAIYPVTSDSGHSNLAFACGRGGYDSLWGPWDGFWSGLAANEFPFYDWFFTTAIWPPLQMDMKSLAIIPRPYPADFIRLIVAEAPLSRDTVFRSSSLSGPDRVPVFWEADTVRMVRARTSDSWVFLASDRGIYRSTDEGTTWHQKSTGMSDSNIVAIALPDGGHRVFAVSPGAAYVSNDDGDSWQTAVTGVAPPPVAAPGRYTLEQNYPNPFNPGTSIRYQLTNRCHVTLEVLDILGRHVTTLVDGIEGPGDMSVSFSGTGIAGGTYLYRLRAGDLTLSRRMILLR